jgi:hypothetical protein
MRSPGFFLAPALALAVAPYHASAQPVAPPSVESAPVPAPVPLDLAIEIEGSGDLDPTLVRGAIAADLDVQVAASPQGALGSLLISIVPQGVRIVYLPLEGTAVERTVALPASRDDRTRLITFIATNLVRDQASEILAGLPALPPPAAVVTAAAPAAAVTAAASAAAPAEPAVVVVPVARAAAAVVATPSAVHVPISIGMIPPLAVDRLAGRRVVVGVGIHAVAGASDGSRYASISGAIDTKHEFAAGAQIAGALVIAGRVDDGLQIGGAAALSRGPTDGGQIGGALAFSLGDLAGLQLAGAAAVTQGNTTGIQIGGAATYTRGHSEGLQLAGAGAVTGSMRGLQLAGGAAVAGRLEGVQIAGGVNVAGDVRGLQLGTINVARRMRGVQLGVVNLSEDGDGAVPIGVINYSKNGPLAVEGWVDSSRVSAVGLRHGTRYVHNLWAIGWSPDHEHVMVGAGLGVHAALVPGSLGLDVEAMHWMTDVVGGDPDKNLSQLRASVSASLGPVDVFAGAALNVHVVTDDEMQASEDFHPVAARRFTSAGGTYVTVWPMMFAGARVPLR